MPNTDKDIISILLKSVFNKGLISEMTYRNSLNRLYAFDDSLLNSCNKSHKNDTKEYQSNGCTKN